MINVGDGQWIGILIALCVSEEKKKQLVTRPTVSQRQVFSCELQFFFSFSLSRRSLRKKSATGPPSSSLGHGERKVNFGCSSSLECSVCSPLRRRRTVSFCVMCRFLHSSSAVLRLVCYLHRHIATASCADFIIAAPASE